MFICCLTRTAKIIPVRRLLDINFTTAFEAIYRIQATIIAEHSSSVKMSFQMEFLFFISFALRFQSQQSKDMCKQGFGLVKSDIIAKWLELSVNFFYMSITNIMNATLKIHQEIVFILFRVQGFWCVYLFLLASWCFPFYFQLKFNKMKFNFNLKLCWGWSSYYQIEVTLLKIFVC